MNSVALSKFAQSIVQVSVVTEHMTCVPSHISPSLKCVPALTKQTIRYNPDHHHLLHNFPVL